LWESEQGKLVGVVHPEGTGDAHLELHPDFRHIETPMIEWALGNLASPLPGGDGQKLRIFAHEYDSLRCQLLASLGFEKTTRGEVRRRLRFGAKDAPPSIMPSGYDLRVVNPDNMSDCQHLADLLNAAFNRDFHTAEEFRVFAANAPCCKAHLDLAAVAGDGSFAAYTGVPYVEENRYGVFEPVCTHPDHLRRGLARSLMYEGLRRLKSLGAADVFVGTGDQVAANKLYNSIGFAEAYRMYMWQKTV
jgi:GNAT superfamily N-acetyltransferase